MWIDYWYLLSQISDIMKFIKHGRSLMLMYVLSSNASLLTYCRLMFFVVIIWHIFSTSLLGYVGYYSFHAEVRKEHLSYHHIQGRKEYLAYLFLRQGRSSIYIIQASSFYCFFGIQDFILVDKLEILFTFSVSHLSHPFLTQWV